MMRLVAVQVTQAGASPGPITWFGGACMGGDRGCTAATPPIPFGATVCEAVWILLDWPALFGGSVDSIQDTGCQGASSIWQYTSTRGKSLSLGRRIKISSI